MCSANDLSTEKNGAVARHGKKQIGKLMVELMVEQRTGNAEVTGSNPVEALIFSGFFFPIA